MRDCSGLDRRSEGIPHYTNAPLTVFFIPVGTVVGTGGRFIKNQGFFVDNTCQALLIDNLTI